MNHSRVSAVKPFPCNFRPDEKPESDRRDPAARGESSVKPEDGKKREKR